MRYGAVLLLLLVGCAHPTPPIPPIPPTPPTPITLKWLNDGNPMLPLCTAKPVGCKASYKVVDETDGVIVSNTLTLSATSITFTPQSNSTHTYNIMVNVINLSGVAQVGPPLVLRQ